ncbi:MAG TPA: hypothetical protein VIR58_14870, partial [Acidimicrobiales bacterium]
MVSAPGPVELGRAVLVDAGAASPEGWEGADRICIDDGALAAPAEVVGRLHDAWSDRTPVVIELAVDPGRFRAPVSHGSPLWEVGPDFHDWADRFHFLVWANSYDARGGGEPIWWWARKASRLGAVEGGPADVTLPDGTPAWIDGGPRA